MKEKIGNYSAGNDNIITTDGLVSDKVIKDILNKGITNLIEQYVVVDDQSITNLLVNELVLYKNITGKDDFDFYKSLLNSKINL